MSKEIKTLFTGVGSIGSRHINNLIDICTQRGLSLIIDVIRYSDRVLSEELQQKIRKEIRNPQDLDSHYDVLFITDVTSTHYENIMQYKAICDHMFIEKPIFENLSYNIEDIKPESNKSIYYVAAPIRFTYYFNKLKECVDTNDVFSARIIFSSYMPEWQKERDYRKSFRCFKDIGGGVDIDLLHENDYMVALFGKPIQVLRVAGKYSNLEMEACDLATYIFEYRDKIIEVHLDYFGRVRNRLTELYTKDDVIVVDFNKCSCESKVTGVVENYAEVEDNFYQNEMIYFIDLITSEKSIENVNTPEKAFESLKLSKGYI